MNSSAFGNAHWMIGLINHLWQSTAFAAGCWLLTFALRRNQAQTRHRLWVLASVKFLIPLSLLIAAGGWLQTRMHTPVAQPAGFSYVMEGLTEPFAAGAHTATPAEIAAVSAKDANSSAASAHSHAWLAFALLGLWACGSLLLLAGWVRRWRHLHRAVRSATTLFTVSGVPVLVTPLHMEPGVFGVFRPVILLPEGIRERLSSAQFDAILAHELCHVRRRDNLFGMLHMAVEAIFWFFPVVWWVRQGLLEERERACDEAVLDSRREAMVYAEGIINVCKFYVEAPMSCVSGVTGSDLKKRIVRIMEEQVARKLDLGRKLLLLTAAILVVVLPVGVGLVHAATGQMMVMRSNGIEGAWQGTLPGPMGDRRMVVQIRKDESGVLSATVIQLDAPGPMGVPHFRASDVSFTGDELKFSVGFMSASFDGKMSPDHNSIDGSWTGQQGTQHLLLARATPDTAWAIPDPAPRMKPMAADANPGIEVATIKPSKPGAMMMKGIRVGGNRLIMSNMTLQDLIMFAYDLEPKQIVNAPSWYSSDTYDIEIQPDQPGAPSKEQWNSILQKLLADRFQFKLHTEQRELPAYILTVAKGGPKMTKRSIQTLGGQGGQEATMLRPGTINAQALSMDDFAHTLRRILDRPVIDQTGLPGLWDLNLKWTPDESQFSGMMRGPQPPSDESADAPPPLFTAIQEQLGLKLDSGKAQVPVLVIDSVEKPSAN
jgi:uncharacterized protein (TIGR03435 family)